MPVYFELGCLPPTLNEITDTARRSRYKSADTKKHWTEYVTGRCGGLKSLARNKRVYLECVWFIKNFARDPDNVKAASKFILDGIVRAGILKDDTLAIIQSPVIHWFEKVTNHDSLVFIFYSEAEWKARQKLGIFMPLVVQPTQETPTFSTKPAVQRKRRKKKIFRTKVLAT
jgi:hypothetical protein